MVDQLDANHEDDRGEDGVGKITQRLRQEQQDKKRNGSSGEMSPLTAAASGIHDCRFGWASVHHKCAAAARGDIGQRQTNQVDVLAEVFAVTQGVRARCGGTLREDHNKTRE